MTISYARRIGPFQAAMLVVGGIIGSGIFLNPQLVAQRVASGRLTMLVWSLGALIALAGAFIYAELGWRRPEAGGGYAYLRDAFGPLWGFLYGWALLLVIATGATAAVAVTFARYFLPLVGGGTQWTTPVAVTAIVVLSLVNAVGVAPGALTQTVFTLLKLAALAGVIVVGLVGSLGAAPLPPTAQVLCPVGTPFFAVASALVPVLFAFGGWQQTNFVAEEIVEPERNLPRALVAGVLVVVAVYLLANLAYLRALGTVGLANSTAPAADTVARFMGERGRRLISAGIAASTFGFLDLVILVSPRVYQRMAEDGLFFRSFAWLHPVTRTPLTAIGVGAVWAVILVYSGSYGALLDYVTFADWIFFGLTALTLFVFRRRDRSSGKEATGVRVPLYPVTVVLFALAALYVVVGSIVSNPGNAVRGAGLILLGVPAFLFWRGRWREEPQDAL